MPLIKIKKPVYDVELPVLGKIAKMNPLTMVEAGRLQSISLHKGSELKTALQVIYDLVENKDELYKDFNDFLNHCYTDDLVSMIIGITLNSFDEDQQEMTVSLRCPQNEEHTFTKSFRVENIIKEIRVNDGQEPIYDKVEEIKLENLEVSIFIKPPNYAKEVLLLDMVYALKNNKKYQKKLKISDAEYESILFNLYTLANPIQAIKSLKTGAKVSMIYKSEQFNALPDDVKANYKDYLEYVLDYALTLNEIPIKYLEPVRNKLNKYGIDCIERNITCPKCGAVIEELDLKDLVLNFFFNIRETE